MSLRIRIKLFMKFEKNTVFTTRVHFIKVFKKYQGITPLQYMKRLQNNI